jgi:hypothetical protein
MSKEMWVIVLGLLVIAMPHLGIPGAWKTILFVVLGASIAALGFLLRGESLSRGSGAVANREHFVESTPSSVSSVPHESQGINSFN